MNLLILSCGTRDKVVQYFKAAFAGKGRVVCTDCSPYAPALYEADAHYIVPRITAPEYLDVIYEICKKEAVTGVLSLIDPELSLIAAHAAQFQALGVTVIGSDYALCERTLNKWELYCWMEEHGYPCVKTYCTMESFCEAAARGEVRFPVFVKPMKGSASIQIARADDMETAAFLFAHGEQMILQEYMTGQEIGADVYIDLISRKVVSIFTKKKLVMRAGETDKAVSFMDDTLFAFITKFAEESGFSGQIDIDLFEKDGGYYISEVNPRFGGGYPHAYACGVDHMMLIRNNLMGIENPVRIGGYAVDKVMMKYNELMLVDMV
ncbi:MAG: ATP-grasp domain-containing protein [Lachnospiraceae bacterium]|nr:ATP-grasp domain-containing protein [Lachnospiraceae bacterium]MDE7183668.1 ATP-grasp domain-containing protein [Lachnospiraceae bacterium]